MFTRSRHWNHVAGAPHEQEAIRASRLPVWIIVGAALGVGAGIIFGEQAAVLAPIGSAYAMLLQIAVYPYLICSLLQGLGRLPSAKMGRLLRASWSPYVFLWGTTLAVIWLLSSAIPTPPPPSLLTQELAHPQVGLLDLLIPANLFAALYQNYVPAVVVFAVIYGIAIQGLPTRQPLFDMLETVRAASIRIWGWIVRLAPFGVFALFADTAGTIRHDQLGGLLLYIGLFLAGTAVLAFVVLPLVIAAFAPISYRQLLLELQPALVLAAVTTLSVAALPYVQRTAERIAASAGCPNDEETSDVIRTSLSLSYVFAQLGNYFVYLLILYAAFAANVRFTTTETLLLPFMTLVSCIGSPSATINAVAFLAHWLHLPEDTVGLYIETATVTRYGQVMLSVVGFSFVTIVIPLLYCAKARLRRLSAVAGLCAGVVLLGGVSLACVQMRSLLFPVTAGDRQMSLTLDPELTRGVDVLTHRTRTDDANLRAQTWNLSVQDVQSAGVLRVGYNPEIIPFSYWNADGDLVGFDISFAYQLARDLAVKLEFAPFSWQGLHQDVSEGRFDIALSGIYLTHVRMARVSASRSYYSGPVALIVPSDRATQFTSRALIDALPALRLAVFDDPVLIPLTHRLFPRAAITIVPNYGSLPRLAGDVDGAVWTLPQAAAWAASHPGWTAVAPADIGGQQPVAYMLPPGADNLRAYVDQWLQLKTENGFRQQQIDYWMLGKHRHQQPPRWSLLEHITEQVHR